MKEVWKGIGPLNELVIIHNQRILTMEVAISLYGWPLLDSTALCLCWISNGFTCLVKSQPYSDTYPCKVSDVTNKLLRRGPISFLLLWCISFSKKWANPGFFFVYFWSFQTNIITIFTTNICEKCPSSIRCQDLNSQPSEQESLPITTSTRAPALGAFLCK